MIAVAKPLASTHEPIVADLSHEEIAVRAYARFQARGEEPGYDLGDWLEAERELLLERYREAFAESSATGVTDTTGRRPIL